MTDKAYFKPMLSIDPDKVDHTPSWVIDLRLLENNLKILDEVQRRASCKILLALKGYSTWSTFPLVAKYLAGATASSPHEARLAREELGKEVHSYAPAYSDQDMDEALRYSDHIVFNSLSNGSDLKIRFKKRKL